MHCAALPIVAVALPSALGVLLDHTSLAHWTLLGVAVPVSGYALWRGARQHGSKLGWWIGLAGMFVMLLGVSHLFSARLEVPLSFVGASLVAGAHIVNMRGFSAARSALSD